MSRQTKPLSATEVAKAKPKDKLYRLYDGNGLVLNISPAGGKHWYLQYKQPISKKAQMLKLGSYPAMSLADARSKKDEYNGLLSKGIDPKTHKKQANNNTFSSVANEWFGTKDYAQNNAAITLMYLKQVEKVFGERLISQITTQDCLALLKPMEQTNGKLKRIKSILNQVFMYAIATGRADTNPVINLTGVFKTKSVKHNPAIIDETELTKLVQAIYNYTGSLAVKKCLLFALYTFARQGSIRHIKRQDVVDGVWAYTPSKTKNSTGVMMVTPLSRQAIEIIEQLKQHHNYEYVFSLTGKPLGKSTLLHTLSYIGYGKDKQTVHGFRAIARTLLEEKFKYDYRIIEMQLEHQVRDSNGRAYNRVTWLDERREMLQVWADYIDSLIHSSISVSNQ